MRNTVTTLLIASLALLVACDDGTTQQSDLPTGQAPETTPEPQVEPDADAVAEMERRQQPPVEVNEDQRTELAPAAEATPSQGPGFTYGLPAGWSVGAPNNFRLMTLVAPESAGQLEASVSRGNGEYGGFHSNVMRWAGQVGLSPADAAKIDALQTVMVDGVEAIWLPLINADDNQALIAVWVPRGPDPSAPLETWVFKFPAAPGPVDQVQAGADDFKAFVESIEFE